MKQGNGQTLKYPFSFGEGGYFCANRPKIKGENMLKTCEMDSINIFVIFM